MITFCLKCNKFVDLIRIKKEDDYHCPCCKTMKTEYEWEKDFIWALNVIWGDSLRTEPFLSFSTE